MSSCPPPSLVFAGPSVLSVDQGGLFPPASATSGPGPLPRENRQTAALPQAPQLSGNQCNKHTARPAHACCEQHPLLTCAVRIPARPYRVTLLRPPKCLSAIACFQESRMSVMIGPSWEEAGDRSVCCRKKGETGRVTWWPHRDTGQHSTIPGSCTWHRDRLG